MNDHWKQRNDLTEGPFALVCIIFINELPADFNRKTFILVRTIFPYSHCVLI